MAYMKILNSCWQRGNEISDNASSVLRWIPKAFLLGSSLNTGKNHLNFSYALMGYKLAVITLEKDLCLTGEKKNSVRTSAQLCCGGQRSKELSGLFQGKCVEQNWNFSIAVTWIGALSLFLCLMLQEFKNARENATSVQAWWLTTLCLVLRWEMTARFIFIYSPVFIT